MNKCSTVLTIKIRQVILFDIDSIQVPKMVIGSEIREPENARPENGRPENQEAQLLLSDRATRKSAKDC